LKNKLAMKFSRFKSFALTTALALACHAHAADAPAAQPATPSTQHKLAESIAIDRLVQKVYANSPLNTALLRKTLVDANPKVITGNPQQRVKAGTTIVVPDHSEVVRLTLAPFAAAAQEAHDNNPGARDYQARKQWVRFP
jgi:hypothetical protein